MRDALNPMSRFIAANRIGKRFLFTWQDRTVCPSDLVVVFAFEDDYAMGVLTSSTHMAWADSEMSTLRVDPRTPRLRASKHSRGQSPMTRRGLRSDVWPPSFIEHRQEICVERKVGLTELYNEVDDGAYNELG